MSSSLTPAGSVTLRADGQHVVVELDRDLILRDAREVEREHELRVGLPDVHGRKPARGLPVAGREPRGELAHPAAHLVLKSGKLPERFPTYECHRNPPLVTYF